MDERTCVLGIDLGTTSVKAVAFARDAHTIATAMLPVTTVHNEAQETYKTGESAEQDPRMVANAANAVLVHAAAEATSAGYKVRGIGLSAAMHSFLPLDVNDLPLENALIWMDNRAHQVAEQLWQTSAGQALYDRTGTPIHAMTPLAKLLWMRQQHAALFQRAQRFVSLKEWLWHQWFGEWKIDVAVANATGLYNLATHTWDAEALALAAITAQQLSEIVPVTYTRSAVQDTSLLTAGIKPETTFTIGASDGVLANLAANALDSTCMTFTIGTSCAVRTGIAHPVTDRTTRSFCYTLDQNHYILGGPSNSGGSVLEWLSQQVFGGTDGLLATLLAEAETAQDAGMICLPYAAGERAPLWNEESSATFHGLRLAHSRAHLLRAAIEGIIFNAYWIAEGLMHLVGQPQRVIASGKVLENQWIRQLAADIFGLPVVADSTSDASALGAAKLALVVAGDIDLNTPWGIPSATEAQVLLPTQHEAYRAKYARFRQLCALLNPPEKA